MWNGKKKAITFSFDDSVEQDKRAIEILDKYGLKATFNIMSGYLGLTCERNAYVKKDNGTKPFEMKGDTYYYQPTKKPHVRPSELKEVYKNHEVAVHTLTHFNLTTLSDDTVLFQVKQDEKNIEELTGRKVLGMAYPCGGTNSDERVANLLKTNTDIGYARTNKMSFGFDMPKNPLLWDMSIHFAEVNDMNRLAKEFIEKDFDKPVCYSIWGHTYELDDDYVTWEQFEEFCKLISGRDDIFYGTNSEVCLGITQK